MSPMTTLPAHTNSVAWLSAILGVFASIIAGTFYLLYLLQLNSPLPEPWNTLMHVTLLLPLIGLVALILGIVAMLRTPPSSPERRLALIGMVTGGLAVFAITILLVIVVNLLLASGRYPI